MYRMSDGCIVFFWGWIWISIYIYVNNKNVKWNKMFDKYSIVIMFISIYKLNSFFDCMVFGDGIYFVI